MARRWGSWLRVVFPAVPMAVAVLAVTVFLAPAGSALPEAGRGVVEAAQALARPIPGANEWTCRPGPAGLDPVILVHGTSAPPWLNWIAMGPALRDAGYCVFALQYGTSRRIPGTAPIAASAAQLATFVDGVLAATGTGEVDIVGHSQGGVMPRHYVRFLGGAARVDDLGRAPQPRDPRWALADRLGPVSRVPRPAAGSGFLRALNAGREVEPGVAYTVIATTHDQVVVPHTGGFLAGPPRQVTNATLQDACPRHFTDHVLMAIDPAVLAWVLDALRRPGPADPGFRPPCLIG